jgi:hypothetical protein
MNEINYIYRKNTEHHVIQLQVILNGYVSVAHKYAYVPCISIDPTIKWIASVFIVYEVYIINLFIHTYFPFRFYLK